MISAEMLSEWTYERDAGDLVVFAKDAKDAIAALKEHGFKMLDAAKLRRTGKNLAEYLATTDDGGIK